MNNHDSTHPYRPETYREILARNDDRGRDGLAKWDAENTATALNMRVSYGLEQFPNFKDRDDYEDDED